MEGAAAATRSSTSRRTKPPGFVRGVGQASGGTHLLVLRRTKLTGFVHRIRQAEGAASATCFPVEE